MKRAERERESRAERERESREREREREQRERESRESREREQRESMPHSLHPLAIPALTAHAVQRTKIPHVVFCYAHHTRFAHSATVATCRMQRTTYGTAPNIFSVLSAIITRGRLATTNAHFRITDEIPTHPRPPCPCITPQQRLPAPPGKPPPTSLLLCFAPPPPPGRTARNSLASACFVRCGHQPHWRALLCVVCWRALSSDRAEFGSATSTGETPGTCRWRLAAASLHHTRPTTASSGSRCAKSMAKPPPTVRDGKASPAGHSGLWTMAGLFP